jgi:hypothetical protein
VTEAARTAGQIRRGSEGDSRREQRRPASLILSRGEVMRLKVNRGHLRVTCRAGRLWATSDRDGIDSLLQPDDSVSYEGRGTVVIEALRTATLRLESREAMHVAVGMPLLPALLRG